MATGGQSIWVQAIVTGSGYTMTGEGYDFAGTGFDVEKFYELKGVDNAGEYWGGALFDCALSSGDIYIGRKAFEYVKGGKGASGAKLNKKLMNELAESGVKYNADDVVMITKNSDGELLWLEKGTDSSGFKHIIDGKSTNFADRGITDIPKFLEETLKTKPVRVGSNSKGKYAEYIINGKEYTVAYGTNGYIVSFYPSGN